MNNNPYFEILKNVKDVSSTPLTDEKGDFDINEKTSKYYVNISFNLMGQRHEKLTELHNLIKSNLPAKKYKNNFLVRLDEFIKRHLDEVNEYKRQYDNIDQILESTITAISTMEKALNKDLGIHTLKEQAHTVSRNVYYTISSIQEDNFDLAYANEFDKIAAEELTAEAKSCSNFEDFVELGKERLLSWKYIVNLLDFDDEVRNAYNNARIKFINEYSVDEENMKIIDSLVHEKLSKFLKANDVALDQMTNAVNGVIDEYFKETYTYYMANKEKNNLKR
ncbi:unknown [Coprobacillus sp. CAG:605]|nr:unknown [Coprobacillus sp. CAG:605]